MAALVVCLAAAARADEPLKTPRASLPSRLLTSASDSVGLAVSAADSSAVRSAPEPSVVPDGVWGDTLDAVPQIRGQVVVIGRPEGKRIARVDVIPRNIFDPVPHDHFRPVYRLANRLHIRTRDRTIREHLLFEAGDWWFESAGHETARNLRALSFLTPELIEAREVGDSVIVKVVTRDIWTTSPEFNLESADGEQYGSIAFTERNLLGLGNSFSLSYREEPNGQTRSLSVDDPGVLASRVRFHYAASNASSGATDQVSVMVPFYAEEARHSYGISWNRFASEVSLFEHTLEVANLDRRVEESEIFWGRGSRHQGLVRRSVFSFLVRDQRLGPTRADPRASADFIGPAEDLRIRRVAAEGRLWRSHFIERVNVNRMALIEDFDVGSSVALKLGVEPELLGSTKDVGYARLSLDTGTENRFGFGWIGGNVTSRIHRRWTQSVAFMDGHWFLTTTPRRTLALAAYGILGENVDRTFQVVVGGLNGLRAYPVHAVAGRRLWRLNAEQRFMIGNNYKDLIAVGAVGFVDAARGWGAGASGTGWYTSSGVGLRVALPRWSPSQILRVDVAWPVSPTREGQRRPVLTFGSSQAF